MTAHSDRRPAGNGTPKTRSQATTVNPESTRCPCCAGRGVVTRHPGAVRQQRAIHHLAHVAMPWTGGGA